MLDPMALIEVQRATRALAAGARPDSPVHPDPEPALGARWAAVRAPLSLALRRLADLVEPTPPQSLPTPSGR